MLSSSPIQGAAREHTDRTKQTEEAHRNARFELQKENGNRGPPLRLATQPASRPIKLPTSQPDRSLVCCAEAYITRQSHPRAAALISAKISRLLIYNDTLSPPRQLLDAFATVDPCDANGLTEEHLPGVLNVLLDLDEESDGFPAIKETVIVGESEEHHGADLDLAVDSDGLVLDGVKTEDGGLGCVDDGGAHEGAKDTAVADGEGTTGHVFNCELVVAGLKTESVHCRHRSKVSARGKMLLTFLPSAAISSASMPMRSRLSALRTTGVTRPFSVATATEIST